MEAIEILKSKNINITAQRVKVLDYLVSINGHLTAEQIFDAVSDKKEIVSLATIYNTLNLFVESGILRKIPGVDDKSFYDLTTKDHLHFYCKKCKCIFDVNTSGVDFFSLDFEGSKPESFYGCFSGVCKLCSKEVKENRLLSLFKQKVTIFKRRKEK